MSRDVKIVTSISTRLLNTFTLESRKLVRSTSSHDRLIDDDKFEQKTLIFYILLSFNAFSTNRYTIRLIYVIINGPEDPDEKKKGT